MKLNQTTLAKVVHVVSVRLTWGRRLLRTGVAGGPRRLLTVGVVVVPLRRLARRSAGAVGLAVRRRTVAIVVVPATGRGGRLAAAHQTQALRDTPPRLVRPHWNVFWSLTP